MPRRNDNNGTSKFDGFKTVYLDFSHDEQETIKSLAGEKNWDPLTEIEEAITDGWKVSISYSSGWDNFILSLTPKDVHGFDKRTVFMFRHVSFSRITDVLHFFLHYMVENSDARLQPQVDGHDW